MNFNICLDDETGQQFNKIAKMAGESRNALVRKAASDWLQSHGKSQWHEDVLGFKGLTDMAPFETSRSHLRPPAADAPRLC